MLKLKINPMGKQTKVRIYLQGFIEMAYRTNAKELQGQRNKSTRRTELEETTHVQQLTK